MKFKFILLLVLPVLLGAQTQKAEQIQNLPNDVKWVTDSEEYTLLCEQIYRSAWISIRSRLMNMDNPVIIMDLDETVLDNSQYQIDLHLKSKTYNASSWNKFVKKEISGLVPGVKQFIQQYKKKQNAIIIYLSNRDETTLKATKSNMKKLGILYDDDIFLLREDNDDTKKKRREEVFQGLGRMQNYGASKVIAYFGDATGDFPNDKNYEFGINKFMFPNPMYGEWK